MLPDCYSPYLNAEISTSACVNGNLTSTTVCPTLVTVFSAHCACKANFMIHTVEHGTEEMVPLILGTSQIFATFM